MVSSPNSLHCFIYDTQHTQQQAAPEDPHGRHEDSTQTTVVAARPRDRSGQQPGNLYGRHELKKIFCALKVKRLLTFVHFIFI